MLLDDLVPNPQWSLRQSRRTAASPERAWDELQRLTMADLPLGRALMGLRYLPARLVRKGSGPLGPRTFIEVTPIPVVFADPPHVLVLAGLSQAWRPTGGDEPPKVDAEELRGWRRPGWIVVGMELRLESRSGSTRLTCETRVRATDATTRRVFGLYWFAIKAGSAAIRWEALRAVGRRAEGVGA